MHKFLKSFQHNLDIKELNGNVQHILNPGGFESEFQVCKKYELIVIYRSETIFTVILIYDFKRLIMKDRSERINVNKTVFDDNKEI